MSPNFKIRAECPEDYDAVAKVHDAAFGAESRIPQLVHDFRHVEAPLAPISLVAVDELGTPFGHVMLTHAWLDTWYRLVDVMVLSPLGVHPDHQRQGIGTTLIKASLAAAEAAGAPMVFLEGNDKYYGPRGFNCAVPHNIRRPSLRIPERAFQVHLLRGYKADMTGTFVYRDVHWKHGVGLYRA